MIYYAKYQEKYDEQYRPKLFLGRANATGRD
jgi:hypothetical protein